MASNEKLKILIVDDHDIVRKGLAMLVSRQEDLSVVAEAGTVAEAVGPMLFLLSSHADYVSGALLEVNGAAHIS